MTDQTTQTALPPVVDRQTWQAALDDLRSREKAATRELDAIAAQRRRLPMLELPDYTLIGPDGPIRLVDVFDGRSQLIVYNHMWSDGEQWQCGGCTGLTSQYVRLGLLDNYDARFVIVTNGPIEEALAYKAKVGNTMDWYSSSESSFGADVDAPPGGPQLDSPPPLLLRHAREPRPCQSGTASGLPARSGLKAFEFGTRARGRALPLRPVCHRWSLIGMAVRCGAFGDQDGDGRQE